MSETHCGGGLCGADGTVHRKSVFGNAIQSHRIPDSVLRIMRHKCGLGAAGKHRAAVPGSGTAPSLLRRRDAAVGDGDGKEGGTGRRLTPRTV